VTELFFEPGWLTASAAFAGVLLAVFAGQLLVARIVKHLSYRWPPGLQAIFDRTKAVAHAAVIVLAAAVALPLAPLAAVSTTFAQKLLTAAFIVLLGWIAITAARIGADRYLQRFDLKAADNLDARKAVTQVRVLLRLATGAIAVLTLGLALMTFESVRQYGVSLFASAGVVGIIVGLAAQSTIGNLLAGVQLAMTQPIRVDDVLVVEGEFGRVEEINSSYVVMRLWDWRRLVVPLKYFLETPFQNWTRTSASVIGAALLYVDYTAPVNAIRAKATEIARASPLWDGQVVNLQVTNFTPWAVELRVLVSAATASDAWDLRCHVREELLNFVQTAHPDALPRQRGDLALTAVKVGAAKSHASPVTQAPTQRAASRS
jgi:small-conductance mechanosensitive channel